MITDAKQKGGFGVDSEVILNMFLGDFEEIHIFYSPCLFEGTLGKQTRSK